MMTRILSLSLALTLAACGAASDDDALDTGSDDTGADQTDDTGADEPGADDTPVDHAARGEWTVGYTVIDAALDGSTPQVKAWYPTASDAAEDATYSVTVKLPGFGDAPVPFLGAAVVDAAPADGAYPLVVLSHGFGMNPEWYHPLAEHLASHGYVVLGPEHMESDWFTDVLAATVDRPLEVSVTIDMAEEGLLGGIIDTDDVAVVGHSYGGYTALAVGGARIHTEWYEAQCPAVEDPFVSAMFCGPFVDGKEQLAAELDLDEVPEGLWPSMADDRVDTVVAMAPDAFQFGEVGLAELDLPTLVMGGTGDTGAPWDWGAGLAYSAVSSETLGLVAFEGAEHFIQVTTCDHMPWSDGLPEEYAAMFCEDPAWDKDLALDLTNELVLAFLDHTLHGSTQATQALDPARFDDVAGLDVEMTLP